MTGRESYGMIALDKQDQYSPEVGRATVRNERKYFITKEREGKNEKSNDDGTKTASQK